MARPEVDDGLRLIVEQQRSLVFSERADHCGRREIEKLAKVALAVLRADQRYEVFSHLVDPDQMVMARGTAATNPFRTPSAGSRA